ncbi:MAG: nuclear transport factor 2 family protein [Bacteroidota bacterium]
MKAVFLFLLMLTGISHSCIAQTETTPTEAVRATLMNYINGRNQGDIERLRSAFHPEADLRYLRNDSSFTIWPVQDYISRIQPGRTANCIARIISIDIVGVGAQAKIELEYPNRKYADYINLLKVDGEWLIAVKTFSVEPIDPTKHILFVLTSHEEMGNTGRPTGLHLGEVTHAYRPLIEAGYEVDFVSPKGGAAFMYGTDLNDPNNLWFVQNPNAYYRFTNAMSPNQIDATRYAAIYFVGGHGTMWDLPEHQELGEITRIIYEQDGVVAGVCHGPSGLVNVRLSNGEYLVANKRMTSFTDQEETAARAQDIVPFMLETTLRERGAIFIGADNWQENVIVDERLVTGQNPASARGVAERMIGLLGQR